MIGLNFQKKKKKKLKQEKAKRTKKLNVFRFSLIELFNDL